jgi:dihydroorotate dehydrogenase (NAD+) catalytic subunit
MVAQDPDAVARVVAAVRRATDLPIIAKLSPNVTDIRPVARSAANAGADAVSLINTLLGMAIDIETRHPKIANVTGGLSGPAIHPVAVRMVWETSAVLDVPVIGVGGIVTADDAIEFIVAGASAVAVGSATFRSPRTALDVLDGIRGYMATHDISDINQLVGSIET